MSEILFISDLHLTRDNPGGLERFAQFVSGISDRTRQLYMLGDVFDFWIGDDGAKILGHDRIEDRLCTLSSSGLELFFVPGNRDFLVGQDFASRTGCTMLEDPSVIELDGERILLTHGDTLCVDDIEHQQSRAVMLSSKWRVAFLNKPLEERLDTALSLRMKSEESKQSKPMSIMDINQSHLEKVMLAHGVKTVIHGHTHRPGIHEFSLDGLPARRYVLGDWYTQNSILSYRSGEFTLH
ncbi:MAG: UDP-2,3-diacylglucosamine diphosphatase [Gammaproteobacteria bacterium]|nr:UDP-2,3-diacylglucosamine diphosphatase [Gammaproteobacteria bacterium]MYJ52903.1 UDP-2,3-diacylglucosamine diphosphatase [Gammaproteobacteria bacterium]